MDIDRRELFGAIAAGTLVAAAASARADEKEQPARPQPGKHALVPLPFDPKKLNGLSERLIVSHHENNYGGAVKNLNKTEAELAKLGKDSPPLLVAGLRERELTFANSATRHELYFANLGGDGRRGGSVEKALAETFGSAGRWEELLRAAGMSLAGGSGWALLVYDFQRDALRIAWSGNHTQAAAFGYPLLVLDMYEHAYHIDFGAAAAKYIEAFFRNVKWDEVNGRYDRAVRAAKVLRA